MYKCIKEFAIEKCDGNGFIQEGNYATIVEGSKWFIPEDEDYRVIGGEIRLEHEDGTWLEIDKETLKLHFKEVKDNVIAEVKFNNKPPTKYDYKHFECVLDDGEIKIFNYHKNNPIPKEEEILGLTWNELREFCRKKWYEAIKVES